MTTLMASFESKLNIELLSTLATNLPESCIIVVQPDLTIAFSSSNDSTPSLHEQLSHYHQDVQKLLLAHYRNALDGQATEVDITHQHAGEHHSITPIFNTEGNVENILCIIKSQTTHKHSLDALRESESHLQVATQLAKIGYWELDVDSRIFTFNQQFLDILKITPEQIGGYTMAAQDYAERFLYEEDRPKVQSETQMAIDTSASNFSRYLEHRYKNGLGETGYLAVRYFVAKDEHGRTIKTIGANQDITDRKKSEQKLTKLLKKTTDQNRRFKDFSFMTSHNIRSSVANLVGLCQLLKDEPGNSEYIDMLCATVGKLDNTVKNVNSLLNYENALESEERTNCNIQQSVDRFIKLNSTWIENESIDIQSLLPINLCILYIPVYIDSILHNLLTNAIKYGTTATAKRIEIGAVTTTGPAIYVRDFGNGLDLDKFGAKLFSPGARFHTNKDGQGMGLYMTKNQIESAGGSIDIDSTLGKGTTFTVCFGSE